MNPNTSATICTAKPEWLRIPDATRLFGIGRSSLYELITAGKVRSVCLKQRNALRGIRLINYDSLKAFIEEAVQSQPEAIA